mgnify:CR=1 FL=1
MEKTSVKYRILEAAKPYLEGKTVKDLSVVMASDKTLLETGKSKIINE